MPDLEVRLVMLLSELQPPFNQTQVDEVQHFLDYGEYGLALETIKDILLEERLKPSMSCVREMQQLADIMELDTSKWSF